MAAHRCIECDGRLSDGDRVCPSCGHEVGPAQRSAMEPMFRPGRMPGTSGGGPLTAVGVFWAVFFALLAAWLTAGTLTFIILRTALK